MRTIVFLVLFSAVYTTAQAKPTHQCATPIYWKQAMRQPKAALPRVAVEVKSLHKPFDDFPNLVESENFAFQAGGAAPDAENIQQILAALERSFTHEVLQMGHPAPAGADQFLINVYLGNSVGAPQIEDFAYAYVTLDNQSIPYIVLHPDLLAEYDTESFGFADVTLAHEFYHAVQFGTGAFETNDGYWFWEATADWIAVEVFPEYIDGDAFVPGFLMYPHVPLESFDYPDAGDLIELHHYGAQIFARYISEQVADAELIRDVWLQGGSTETPIEVVSRLLSERGEDFEQVFLDFASHNAVLDYERADSYNAWLESYVPFYPGEDFRVVGSALSAGSDGFIQIIAETSPGKLGYNVIDLSSLEGDAVTIRFLGDAFGSLASESSFRLSLVKRSGDSVEYIPIGVHSNQADATIEGLGERQALLLVITSQPANARGTETFSYKVRALGPLSFSGGSCSVSPQSGSSIWLLFLGLGLLYARCRR
jgi:MYXO-CTERM domain-containing protein